MARLTLRYVQPILDRKSGKVFHYFRRPGYKRVSLPGLPGSAEFMAAYQQALEQPLTALHIGIGRSKPGSVGANVAAYFLSHQFAELAPSTQVGRRCFLQRFRDQYGAQSINMPAKAIKLILAPMKPHAARSGFKALRALCQFAVDTGMIEADPTQSVPRPKAKTKGHRAWTDEEVAQFEARHPIGSKARLASALALYTTQRLGDVVRIGPRHISNGRFAITQNKTGTPVSLSMEKVPKLQAILDATPCEHLVFLVKDSGRPYKSGELSAQFREWSNEAGLPRECKFHGLRATGLTRMADNGCTEHEMAAVSGHLSLAEVQRYTRHANRKRLADQGLARIANI
jgi:integrase